MIRRLSIQFGALSGLMLLYGCGQPEPSPVADKAAPSRQTEVQEPAPPARTAEPQPAQPSVPRPSPQQAPGADSPSAQQAQEQEAKPPSSARAMGNVLKRTFSKLAPAVPLPGNSSQQQPQPDE